MNFQFPEAFLSQIPNRPWLQELHVSSAPRFYVLQSALQDFGNQDPRKVELGWLFLIKNPFEMKIWYLFYNRINV